jgi:multicomponent Na+:H+ antiporter subunit D
MIGVPPTVGFISKWYLALGAYENNLYYVLGVLALSSLLNAAYFLPLIYRMWFLPLSTLHRPQLELKGVNALLVLPLIISAFFTLYFGVFALASHSALNWVVSLVALEYGK